MEKFRPITKYASVFAIGLGLGVVGVSGKMCYDSINYFCKDNTEILSSEGNAKTQRSQDFVTGGGLAEISITDNTSSKEDEREKRSQNLGAGVLLAGLGFFGMVMGYEGYSHYCLNGRDPLHLLSTEF